MSDVQISKAAVEKTITDHYLDIDEGINLEVGGFGNRLVQAGYITINDLTRCRKAPNDIQCLVSDHVRQKWDKLDVFLECLIKSGQSIGKVLLKTYNENVETMGISALIIVIKPNGQLVTQSPGTSGSSGNIKPYETAATGGSTGSKDFGKTEVKGKIFISYADGYCNDRVHRMTDALRKTYPFVFIASTDVRGNRIEWIAKHITRSDVVVSFFSQHYAESQQCTNEIEFASRKEKNIIPVKLQAGYQLQGTLCMLLGGSNQVDYSSDVLFHAAYTAICQEIDHYLQ